MSHNDVWAKAPGDVLEVSLVNDGVGVFLVNDVDVSVSVLEAANEIRIGLIDFLLG